MGHIVSEFISVVSSYWKEFDEPVGLVILLIVCLIAAYGFASRWHIRRIVRRTGSVKAGKRASAWYHWSFVLVLQAALILPSAFAFAMRPRDTEGILFFAGLVVLVVVLTIADTLDQHKAMMEDVERQVEKELGAKSGGKGESTDG